MSCGLGAVVLVFMIVKHHVDNSATEVDLMQTELEELQSQERDLLKSEQETVAILNSLDADIQSQSTAAAEAEDRRRRAFNQLQNTKRNLTDLEVEVENLEPQKADDVITTEPGGEEDYVIGLRVEGAKIGLLVDTSSSMTDKRLIDVIQRKARGQDAQRNGPKWKRTIRIVNWLLARLPRASRVSVVGFQDKAFHLGAKGWTNARDAAGLSEIISGLKSVTPQGATNLQAGLRLLNKQRPTDIYIITDGLPTTGVSNYVSLNPFANCNSLLGKSTTISGECRKRLFRQTISESAPMSGTTVNVILLPIEGDPEASAEFWGWSAATGGLLMTPAERWP